MLRYVGKDRARTAGLGRFAKLLSVCVGCICYWGIADPAGAQLTLPIQTQEATPATDAKVAVPGAADHSVQLDVVVTDKSGKPVAGLQQQDFTVLDDKSATKILSFQAHSEAAIPLGRVDPTTEVIVVMDEENTAYQKVTYAREGVKKFLAQNHGELLWPVSLAFFSDSGLQLQTEPSVDGEALARALDQHRQSLRDVLPGTGVYGAEELLQRSLDALDVLIAREEKQPGRKMVIWVSPGWSLFADPHDELTKAQQQRAFDRVVRLSTGLRQARITLYSLDPQGLDEATTHTTFYRTFSKGIEKPSEAELGDFGLQVLVEQTGGQALFGNAPIESYLRRCMADLSAFYTIDVGEKRIETAGEFHHIEVTVDQRGLKVRTRNGYYTSP